MSSSTPDIALSALVGHHKGKPRHRRVQSVIQMEDVECGAACLSMILAFYGRYVSLEELRSVCGVSRDGASAGSILRAARRYGLNGSGYQMDVKELAKITSPTIVFWGFQHFVVVERFVGRGGREQIWIVDPASGRRRVSKDEFNRQFTGIVLILRPTAEFASAGSSPSMIRQLTSRYLAIRPKVSALFCISVVLATTPVFYAGLNRFFVDLPRLNGSPSQWFVGAVASVMVGHGLAMSLQTTGVARLSHQVGWFSGARLFRRMLSLPNAFFNQRSVAELGRRMRATSIVSDFISREVVSAAMSLVLTVVYAVVLLVMNAKLGLVAVASSALSFVALVFAGRARREAAARLRSDRGRLLAATYSNIRQIESIKASGLERSVLNRWLGFHAKLVTGEMGVAAASIRLMALGPLVSTVGLAVVLLLGGRELQGGMLSAGALVALLGLVNSLQQPVGDLSRLHERLQDVTADLDRIADVENYPVDTDLNETGAQPLNFRRLSGEVSVRNLTFAYGPFAKPVVSDVSFALRPGRRTALVGASGSGKSTVGKVLAGLIEATSGTVEFGGRSREEYTSTELQMSVAYVDQSPVLFDGSIRENVTLWADGVSDQVVWDALRSAAISTNIENRDGGLNFVLTENGRDLSGGQRQRIAIARAIVRRPTILILDEATSALDADAERVIDDSLRRLGATCLIIAHRLSTVRDADHILVMAEGAIVEQGTHHELLAIGGEYCRLVMT